MQINLATQFSLWPNMDKTFRGSVFARLVLFHTRDKCVDLIEPSLDVIQCRLIRIKLSFNFKEDNLTIYQTNDLF